jgi:hypothetical protein
VPGTSPVIEETVKSWVALSQATWSLSLEQVLAPHKGGIVEVDKASANAGIVVGT